MNTYMDQLKFNGVRILNDDEFFILMLDHEFPWVA